MSCEDGSRHGYGAPDSDEDGELHSDGDLDADEGGIGGGYGSPPGCGASDSAEDGEPHSGDGSSEDGSESDSSEDGSHSDDEDLSATNLNSPDVVSCGSDSCLGTYVPRPAPRNDAPAKLHVGCGWGGVGGVPSLP